MPNNAMISRDAILLRRREVAAMYGVHERTVNRWVTIGLLEPVRIGGATRYRRADVEALAGLPKDGKSPPACATADSSQTDVTGVGDDRQV